MTDQEFDILDELYFLTSFKDLADKVDLPEGELKDALKLMIGKGWVKMLLGESDEIIDNLDDFYEKYDKYNYLATKEGLLAHNSR